MSVMLWWINGNTRKEKSWNREFCLKIGAAPIIKGWRVTWDGLVIYKEEWLMHRLGRVNWFKSKGKKCKGRPKIALTVVKKDMTITEVTEIMISNKIEWQKIIHEGNPKGLELKFVCCIK